MFEDKYEETILIFLIALMIFIVGVQIGIHHGRQLQQQEFIHELYD